MEDDIPRDVHEDRTCVHITYRRNVLVSPKMKKKEKKREE